VSKACSRRLQFILESVETLRNSTDREGTLRIGKNKLEAFLLTISPLGLIALLPLGIMVDQILSRMFHGSKIHLLSNTRKVYFSGCLLLSCKSNSSFVLADKCFTNWSLILYKSKAL
jgi:hypothetical protein